ncbi:MAG: hypothetical protein WAL30_04735 [Candidatus Aquirickettsiella sp.]
MPKLQARFKDSIRTSNKNTAVLMTVISCGNHLQSGKNWDHFLALSEQSYAEKTLEKLIIITTGYLQRHYLSLGLKRLLTEQEIEEKTLTLDSQWLKNHIKIPSGFKIPIEVISWQDLLNKTSNSNSLEFGEFFQQITEDYRKKDSAFRNLVNEHAASYVAKKINSFLKENIDTNYDQFLKVAIDYILEECAAIVQLNKCGGDFLSYPGGMNPPARHIWNKYFQENSLRYVRYEIKQEKPSSPSPYTHFKPKKVSASFKDNECHLSCFVKCNLETSEWNIKQEVRFIKEFRKLIHRIDNYSEFFQTQQDAIQIRKTIIHRNSI